VYYSGELNADYYTSVRIYSYNIGINSLLHKVLGRSPRNAGIHFRQTASAHVTAIVTLPSLDSNISLTTLSFICDQIWENQPLCHA